MASGGDWDAEQMLVMYIYDYMLRKNLHTAAEMFAGDANVGKTPVGMRLLSSCAEYLSSLLVSMTVSEYFLSSCGGESVTADIAMYIRGIYGMGLLRMMA
ncbi:hypothetical protein C3L33_05659, partial [Rhododendron williamsianum]